jgi:hypothetical protein
LLVGLRGVLVGVRGALIMSLGAYLGGTTPIALSYAIVGDTDADGLTWLALAMSLRSAPETTAVSR